MCFWSHVTLVKVHAEICITKSHQRPAKECHHACVFPCRLKETRDLPEDHVFGLLFPPDEFGELNVGVPLIS